MAFWSFDEFKRLLCYEKSSCKYSKSRTERGDKQFQSVFWPAEIIRESYIRGNTCHVTRHQDRIYRLNEAEKINTFLYHIWHLIRNFFLKTFLKQLIARVVKRSTKFKFFKYLYTKSFVPSEEIFSKEIEYNLFLKIKRMRISSFDRIFLIVQPVAC